MPINVNHHRWHIIIGSAIGNLAEWYNILLYVYLASIISPLFFPNKNVLLSLTLGYTLFAMSFMMRPLGGILFGMIGDRYGRQRALVVSIALMGIPTFLIGVLPTYAMIGVLSPILLCVLRLCQGLSVGGELTGSAIYLAELAPMSRRTLWVSFVPASAAIGLLMSSLALAVIVHFSLSWRMGYFFGTFISLISFWLRLHLPETTAFEKRSPTYLKEKNLLTNFFIVTLLASCYGIIYQILFIWMPTYLTSILHFNQHDIMPLISVCIFILMGLYLVVGWMADYISRRLILSLACIGFIVLSYPLFLLLNSGVIYHVCIAMGMFTLLLGMFVPTAFICMLESFDIHVRYTGFSLAFNLGLTIFGGTCPLVVTWLITRTHSNISPAFYQILAGVLALIACYFIPDKRQKVI